jgi:hypothetical protein
MYNLVIIKDSPQYVVSVFDYKNNEIWNTRTYFDFIWRELKPLKFKFDNVIYDDFAWHVLNGLDCYFKPTIAYQNASSIPLDNEKPIANEGMTSYGLARYLHRMFLKHNKLVATK